MKKSLLIVALLAVGAQLQCMAPMTVAEAEKQIKVINTKQELILKDTIKAQQAVKKAEATNSDRSLTRDKTILATNKLLAAQDTYQALRRSYHAGVEQIKGLQQAKIYLETIENLTSKVVDLGGDAAAERNKLYAKIREKELVNAQRGEEIQKMQQQLKEARLPWYKRFYYNYLAPKNKREEVSVKS